MCFAGDIDDKIILIPSYLDIQLCVAEGYKNGSRQEWNQDVSVFARNIDTDKLNSYKGSKSEYHIYASGVTDRNIPTREIIPPV